MSTDVCPVGSAQWSRNHSTHLTHPTPSCAPSATSTSYLPYLCRVHRIGGARSRRNLCQLPLTAHSTASAVVSVAAQNSHRSAGTLTNFLLPYEARVPAYLTALSPSLDGPSLLRRRGEGRRAFPQGPYLLKSRTIQSFQECRLLRR